MNIQQGGFQRGGILAIGNNTIREEVYNMLNTNQLNYIDNNSKYGVIFSLNLSPADDITNPFLDLETNEKVHSFIIKLAVIKEHNEDYVPIDEDELDEIVSLDEYKVTEGREERTKYYSNLGSLFYEANVQQYVWAKSFSEGNDPLCPPVVDIILISSENINKVSGNEMINKFYDEYVIKPSNENKGVYSFKLGLIIMPMVANATTLLEWVNKQNKVIGEKSTQEENEEENEDEEEDELIDKCTPEKIEVYSTVISQILRLFLNIGVIHFDLHADNILVYNVGTQQNPIYKTKIIDFAISSIITNSSDDAYLTHSDKYRSVNYRKNRLIELPKSLSKTCNNNKITFVTYVLEVLIIKNIDVYEKIFVGNDPQLQWDFYDPVKRDKMIQLIQLTNITLPSHYDAHDISLIKCNAYDLFFKSLHGKKIKRSPTPSMEELKMHMAEKRMYDYKFGNILNIEDEDTPVKSCKVGTMCTLMGGTRSRRTSSLRLKSRKKRYNKSRKTKRRRV
jgi:hypothetical protein